MLKAQSELKFKNSPVQFKLLSDLLYNAKKSNVIAKTANITLTGKKRVNSNFCATISNAIFQWCGEFPTAVSAFRHFFRYKLKFTAVTKSSKRDNSIVKTVSGNCYVLNHILSVQTESLSNACIGIGTKCDLNSDPDLPCNVYTLQCNDKTDHVVDLTSVLCEKYIVLEGYCVLLPNTFEFD